MSSGIYSTRRWRKLRAAKLAEQPTCEPCERRGKIVGASTVDHCVAIAAGGDPYPPLEGLMSMCTSCHSTKTNARDNPHAFGNRWKAAFKGCGIDGRPLDPDHPFLQGIGGSIAGASGPLTGGSTHKFSKFGLSE